MSLDDSVHLYLVGVGGEGDKGCTRPDLALWKKLSKVLWEAVGVGGERGDHVPLPPVPSG